MDNKIKPKNFISPVKFQYRYALLFGGVLILVLATFLGIIMKDYWRYKKEDAGLLKARFNDYVELIDDDFDNVRSRIKELSISAELDLLESSLQKTQYPYIYKFLKTKVNDGKVGFDLDDCDELGKGLHLVNLTGIGQFIKRDQKFDRLVKMSLNLADDFHGVKLSLPEITFLFCMSKLNTIVVYPFLDSKEFFFDTDIYNRDHWRLVSPLNNPDKKVVWTNIYFDPYENGGLMTTCAAPIYDGGELVANVGADLKVDYLNSVVKKFEPERKGQMLIYDKSLNIVAHPQQLSVQDKGGKKLVDVLPKKLQNIVKKVKSIPYGKMQIVDDYKCLRGSLNNAPFEVLYIVPVKSFVSGLIKRVGWEVILFVIAMLILVLGSLLVTQHNFIAPTEKFVNFILSRSNGEVFETFPKTPKIWHGWFRTIDNVFNENKKLYQNLQQSNEELLRNNAELSRQIEARNMAEKEKETLEDQLRQSEKMRTIGQLASGIAHDLNNQLSVVLATSQVMKMKSIDEAHRKQLKRIMVATRRSTDLINQLLAFSQQGKYETKPVRLHSLVGEVVDIVEHSFDKRIQVSVNLEAQDDLVLGDSSQLQNAILNIAINAKDAMVDGGKLKFSTTNMVLSDKFCQQNQFPLSPGSYIRLCVNDTGPGMEKETLSRIFEPFFTTKPVGKGLGMGLAAVYGTIKNHHGLIDVESKIGVGTTFSLILPLSKGWTDLRLNEDALEAQYMAGKNILLLDDEKEVCISTAEALSAFGFKVVFYENSKKALEYYEENWSDIDVVVLDMIMPELNGHEVFIKMKKINPKVKAIAFSGYSMEGDIQSVIDDGVLALVQKPLDINRLIDKLDSVLTEKMS